MKFELTYFDASKAMVEVSDAELRLWLAGRAAAQAQAAADKVQEAKGAVVSAIVKP